MGWGTVSRRCLVGSPGGAESSGGQSPKLYPTVLRRCGRVEERDERGTGKGREEKQERYRGRDGREKEERERKKKERGGERTRGREED